MNTNTVAAGLADVRAQFDSWRKQRRRGQRIPARLWRRAARAAREYGLSPVSHALGLDYQCPFGKRAWGGFPGAKTACGAPLRGTPAFRPAGSRRQRRPTPGRLPPPGAGLISPRPRTPSFGGSSRASRPKGPPSDAGHGGARRTGSRRHWRRKADRCGSGS